MIRYSFVLVACVVAVFVASACSASAEEEWPQFRGPTGQGISTAHDLPTTFDDQQNVAWKVAIEGTGWSSPVIDDDRIWLTTSLDEGHSLKAICVDRDSGEIVHDVEVFAPAEPPKINAKNSYASPTPVLCNGRVFVNYGTLGTACLDATTGEVLWRNTEVQLDHKEGPGSSPVMFEDLIIVNCDGMDVQYVVAYRQSDGKIAWQSTRPEPLDPNPDFRKAYCTPLLVETDAGPQLISPGASRVISYNPRTGKMLWQVDYKGFSNVPRPVWGEGLVYVCTGFMKPQLLAIRPDGQGNVTDSHVDWNFTAGVPNNPSPLLVDGRLYMVSDAGVASCLDATTGKLLWKERLGGNYSASPLWADGRIYVGSEDGSLSVIAPGDTFQRLAVNQLEGRIMASPAAVGRELYIRTDTALYRFEKPLSTAAKQ